jgi:hypothetical protein
MQGAAPDGLDRPTQPCRRGRQSVRRVASSNAQRTAPALHAPRSCAEKRVARQPGLAALLSRWRRHHSDKGVADGSRREQEPRRERSIGEDPAIARPASGHLLLAIRVIAIDVTSVLQNERDDDDAPGSEGPFQPPQPASGPRGCGNGFWRRPRELLPPTGESSRSITARNGSVKYRWRSPSRRSAKCWMDAYAPASVR